MDETIRDYVGPMLKEKTFVGDSLYFLRFPKFEHRHIFWKNRGLCVQFSPFRLDIGCVGDWLVFENRQSNDRKPSSSA